MSIRRTVSTFFLGGTVQMGEFKNIWKTRTAGAKVLFILSIAYAISSINILLLAFGLVGSFPGVAFNPRVIIAYSILSFLYGLILSVYHLFTFLIRRKRKDDKAEHSGSADQAA
jgi:hypothetical protein